MKHKNELANYLYNKISKNGIFNPEMIKSFLREFERENERTIEVII